MLSTKPKEARYEEFIHGMPVNLCQAQRTGAAELPWFRIDIAQLWYPLFATNLVTESWSGTLAAGLPHLHPQPTKNNAMCVGEARHHAEHDLYQTTRAEPNSGSRMTLRPAATIPAFWVDLGFPANDLAACA